MKLSIIIVSWNVKGDLADCIRSIGDNRPCCDYEVIVVDNASSDGSAEMVEERYPEVRLLANEENLGFATGNNVGIGKSRGEYLLLLNPDTIVHSGSLDALVKFMDENADVGVCGPKLLNTDGTTQPSARGFPTLRGVVHCFTIMRAIPIFHRCYNSWMMRDFAHDKQTDVDQVMGAALMVRRSIFEALGGMDESFFMYYEEVDLCYRIKQSGWRVVFTPKAVITHRGGQSVGQIPVRRRIMTLRSILIFLRKHRGKKAIMLFNVFFKPAVFLQDIYNVLRAAVTWLVAVVTFKRKKRIEAGKRLHTTSSWLIKHSWRVLFRI